MRARLVNESLNEDFGQKDLVRMQDIKTKAAGNTDKEISLASAQAKIITDAGKAKARAEAAEQVFGPDSEIANIFDSRARDLGGTWVKSTASKGVLAPVKKAVGKGEKIQREFKKDFFLPSERIRNEEKKKEGEGGFFRKGDALKAMGIGRYANETTLGGKRLSPGHILPVGSVNFGTGECQYFNIYTTWPDSTAEIWKVGSKYKAVFTSGETMGHLGDIRAFYHDQTGRPMGEGELVDYVSVKNLKELIRVYGGSMQGYTYK